jgi:hypothetical protein
MKQVMQPETHILSVLTDFTFKGKKGIIVSVLNQLSPMP